MPILTFEQGVESVTYAEAFMLLDSSTLGTRSQNLTHQPLEGGLPQMTIRETSGLSGTLDVLCEAHFQASAIYEMHKNPAPIFFTDQWTGIEMWYAIEQGGSCSFPLPTGVTGWYTLRITGVQEINP